MGCEGCAGRAVAAACVRTSKKMDFAPGIDPRERIFDSSLDEAKEMLERVKAGHQTLTEGISEFLFKGSNNSATTPDFARKSPELNKYVF